MAFDSLGHARALPVVRRKKLAIVGGGYGGVCTALKAAEHLHDVDGQPFHITLIEKEPLLFLSTALLAGQLHGGNEYMLHWPTAEACMRSAIRWRLEMPEEAFYTDREPMKYTISTAGQKIGERCEDMILMGKRVKLKEAIQREGSEELEDGWLRCVTQRPLMEDTPPYEQEYTLESSKDGANWEPVCGRRKWQWKDGYTIATDDHGKLLYLTVARAIDHCRKLQDLYRELVVQVSEERGWTIEDTEKALLGPVDKFLQPLDKEEMNIKVAGGFRSGEIGINVPYQLAYLQQALEKLQEDGSVTILTNHKVTKRPEKHGDRFHLTIQDLSKKEKEERTIEADRIVTAAWDGNPALNGLREGERITVHHRAILLVDIRYITEARGGTKLQPVFVMPGDTHASEIRSKKIAKKSAIMIAPRNDKIALVYEPLPDGGAYHYGYRILTQNNTDLPKLWNTGVFPIEKCNPLQIQWANNYFDLAKERVPDLRPEPIADLQWNLDVARQQRRKVPSPSAETPYPYVIAICIGNVLNFQYGIEQREHEPSREVMPGWVTIHPTKATHAWRCADEAYWLLQARELNLADPELMILKQDETFLPAIRGELAISKYEMPNDAYLWKFMKSRNLDSELADMHRDPNAVSKNPRKPSQWANEIEGVESVPAQEPESPINEAPRIRQLYQLDQRKGALKAARKSLDQQFANANRAKVNGDFGERFQPLHRSGDTSADHSSLVRVVIPNKQPLHIHPE